MSIVLILIAAWMICGAAGFIHWWRADWPLTTCELPMVFIGALMGPVAWLVGYAIHGKSQCRTILPRRKT